MLEPLLSDSGRADRELVSRSLYTTSLGSILLCIVLWIRAKTIGEDERGNAERRALFVGLWPPMFWLIGDTVARRRRSTLPSVRRRFSA
jgi:hypothetical protein